MNITVYLGASKGNDNTLANAVRELGTWIGESGNSLVYGGSKSGLMGEIAESVLRAGGKVTGVEPQFFIDAGFVYDVSNVEDVNELYVISDILITDYSSVFFDYANLKRPIIFYMYDYEEYKNELRDFYIDVNELPGRIVRDENELADAIEGSLNDFNVDNKYLQFNNKFNYLDGSDSSRRALEKIIN